MADEEYDWDEQMVNNMAEDIFDYLHVAAPQEMKDDEVHQLGKIVCLAVMAKLGGFLPQSAN